MVKNLQINFAGDPGFNKSIVHKIVGYLKSSLNFKVNSLSINFVTANEITFLNIKYLNHHNSTDIITFNYSGNHSELDGEIFISFDDCRNNARMLGVKYNEEAVRLIIHGILHLLGYNDKIKLEKKKMFELQENLLNNCKFVL